MSAALLIAPSFVPEIDQERGYPSIRVNCWKPPGMATQMHCHFLIK